MEKLKTLEEIAELRKEVQKQRAEQATALWDANSRSMHFRFDALSNGKYGSPPQRTPFMENKKAKGLLPLSDFGNLDSTSKSHTIKDYGMNQSVYFRTPNPNGSRKFNNLRRSGGELPYGTPSKNSVEVDGYFGTQGQGQYLNYNGFGTLNKNSSLPSLRQQNGPAAPQSGMLSSRSNGSIGHPNRHEDNDDSYTANPYDNPYTTGSGHGGANLFQSTKDFNARDTETIRKRNQERLQGLEETYNKRNSQAYRDFENIRPKEDLKSYDSGVYKLIANI